MKKLLFFDQTGGTVDVVVDQQYWQLQRVTSISEVLSHYFFCLPATAPDMFVVCAASYISETSALLRYLKKYRPRIPFVLIVGNNAHAIRWRIHLKGTDVALLEQSSVSGFLDQFVKQ